MLCHNKESIKKQRQGTKRKQDQKADSMLIKSAERCEKAVVGYSVMVQLPEVDRGRC